MEILDLFNEKVEMFAQDGYFDELTCDMNIASLDYVIAVNGSNIPCGYLAHDDIMINSGKHVRLFDLMYKNFTVAESRSNVEKILDSAGKTIDFPIIIVDDTGKYQGVISTRKTVAILYKDVKYVESILNSLDVGIFATDRENRIAFYNDEWKRIHSVTEKDDENLIGEDVKVSFPETLITADIDGDMANSARPLYFQYSGATVMPLYKPLIDEKKEILGSVALVRAYNEKQNLSIELKEAKSINTLLTSIFNNLKESVAYIDENSMVSYANPAFINTYGIALGETIRNRHMKNMISAILKEEHSEVREEDYTLMNVAGDAVDVKISLLPVIDSFHVARGRILIIQDVTDIKMLNAEIEQKSSLLSYYEKHINKIPQEMICLNPKFKEIISTALKVAEKPTTVLIEGENGTGKEMVANLIYSNSDRKDKPFIPVNCGAIPETLWESEMFGYEEGAFTGSVKGGKQGIFEMADGGTVLLDEIGELSNAAQVKMLRFLQNMEIATVGMSKVKKVDVRIIAATNRPLETLVREHKFRMDLYYRLNVVNLKVPPLRERPEEIIPLANFFVRLFNNKYGKNAKLSKQVEKILAQQMWPGNIRQLRNVIEHGIIMSDNVILPLHLPLHMNEEASGLDVDGEKIFKEGDISVDMPAHIRTLEKTMIKNALVESGGNKTKAIERLQISRKTFYKKLKEYGFGE